MKKKKDTTRFKHLLVMDTELLEKVKKAMHTHRPFMENRNKFLTQLIALGIEKLEETEKRK